MAMTQSRIPLPAQVNTTSRYQNVRKRSDPSNATNLQTTFQQKLMREKEQKLIDIYEDNQRRALDKVSRGVRSKPNSGSSQVTRKPPRPDPERYSAQDKNNRRTHIPRWVAPPSYHKNGSAGRDRSNLLEPIEKNNPRNDRYEAHVPTPPLQFKPKLVRSRRPKEQRQTPPQRAPYDRERFENMNSSDEDNLTSAALDHIRRQQHSRNQKPKSPTHLTDFEKWQVEQDVERQVRIERAHLPRSRENSGDFRHWQKERDIERENRMKKARLHRPQHTTPRTSEPPAPRPKPRSVVPKIHFADDEADEKVTDSADENDWEAEIKRKEQELIVKIKQQQAELERMRLEREKQEDEERAEEEKEMKRKAAEKKKLLLEMQQWNESNDDQEEDEILPEAPPQPRRITDESKPKPRVKKWEPPPITDDEEERIAVNDEPASRFYEEAALAAEAASDANVNLRPCSNCGRKFAAERLDKHRQACYKTSKKRKVFDSTKMRTAGTDAHKHNRGDQDSTPQKKRVNWRAQHQDFIKSIRYAKKLSQVEAAGGNISDLPPPPPSENPDYVQCPYCERRFNPTTAERHIPKCKDIKARPAPPSKKAAASRRR